MQSQYRALHRSASRGKNGFPYSIFKKYRKQQIERLGMISQDGLITKPNPETRTNAKILEELVFLHLYEPCYSRDDRAMSLYISMRITF